MMSSVVVMASSPSVVVTSTLKIPGLALSVVVVVVVDMAALVVSKMTGEVTMVEVLQ